MLAPALHCRAHARLAYACRGSRAFSDTSRFAQIQKLYNTHLREWYWQRNLGTKYQTWLPPGLLFCAMKKDHFDIGASNMPTWENWWFHDLDKPLIIGVGSGLWCLDLAHNNMEYNVLHVDSDDKNIFNTLLRAADAYELNIDDMEPFFNFRMVYSHYRLLPQIIPFQNELFKAARLHLHFPPRQKTIALVPQQVKILNMKPQKRSLVAPTTEVQGLSKSLHQALKEIMAEGGTIHIACDSIEQSEAIASQMLELKHVFDPMYAFPFYQEGLPPNYGKIVGAAVDKPIYYQEWRKSDRRQPNALFRGKVLLN